MYTCIYIYLSIYIYSRQGWPQVSDVEPHTDMAKSTTIEIEREREREREREVERERERERERVCAFVSTLQKSAELIYLL